MDYKNFKESENRDISTLSSNIAKIKLSFIKSKTIDVPYGIGDSNTRIYIKKQKSDFKYSVAELIAIGLTSNTAITTNTHTRIVELGLGNTPEGYSPVATMKPAVFAEIYNCAKMRNFIFPPNTVILAKPYQKFHSGNLLKWFSTSREEKNSNTVEIEEDRKKNVKGCVFDSKKEERKEENKLKFSNISSVLELLPAQKRGNKSRKKRNSEVKNNFNDKLITKVGACLNSNQPNNFIRLLFDAACTNFKLWANLFISLDCCTNHKCACSAMADKGKELEGDSDSAVKESKEKEEGEDSEEMDLSHLEDTVLHPPHRHQFWNFFCSGASPRRKRVRKSGGSG